MNSNTFRMPVRRRAAATAAVATLVAGPMTLAGPVHATGGGAEGRANAVVLRADLDVSLLNKTVQVPLTASLNAVKAPADAGRTTLSAQLDGVDRGKPFQMLRADVATAKATAGKTRAEGYANLAHARIHIPGLPLLSLIEVEKVTSRAVCEAGKRPTATSNVLGRVKVLGKQLTATAGGRTTVTVPGVGEVTLDLSATRTASRTAAATALKLTVAVNPLNLNVAEVKGAVTLVEAECTAPKVPAKIPQQRPAESTPGVEPQGGSTPTENLAETGGSSATPYLAGGAALLVALGGGAVLTARSRSRARARG